MRRGKICGMGVLTLAATLLTFASPAPARSRFVSLHISGHATNGYRFDLQALNGNHVPKSVAIELRREGASAIYIDRHPNEFNRRRVSARFGDLGEVSLRMRGGRTDRFDNGCGTSSVRAGRFRGAIRFDGETGYTRVREERPVGAIFVDSFGRCDGPIAFRRAPRGGDSIVGSCGPDAGTGFFALEDSPDEPTLFLGSSLERTPEMLVFRSVILDGAARNLKVARDRSSARVRPPEPFYGRARIAAGEMTGRMRVGLPGAGLVPLTPAPATITPYEDFEPPSCFPFARLLGAGSSSAEQVARTLKRRAPGSAAGPRPAVLDAR